MIKPTTCSSRCSTTNHNLRLPICSPRHNTCSLCGHTKSRLRRRWLSTGDVLVDSKCKTVHFYKQSTSRRSRDDPIYLIYQLYMSQIYPRCFILQKHLTNTPQNDDASIHANLFSASSCFFLLLRGIVI